MSKVLFIDARVGGDFTLDAVWAGLVSRHGYENVVDWPVAKKHREGVPIETGDKLADYGAERRSLGFTPESQKIFQYSLNGINELIRTGQIERIFIDEREESYVLYLQTLARHFSIPVVVVAGHDRFWCQSVQILQERYGKNLERIFMDNWRPEYDSLPSVSPMSYATNFDHLWNVEEREDLLRNKVYNICFMGYHSHGDRGIVVDHLVKKYGHDGNCLFVERRPDIVDSFLPKREYFRKIAQSRICVNLRGAAECGKALRFYEIPYVGSYMLSQEFRGRQVHPFQEGVHCDYFDSIEKLDEMIGHALSNPERREKIARQGHEHAMKFHTARARVDYMYGELSGQI